MSNRAERDKQLVEIICCECGAKSTITFAHWRRYKDKTKFYCRPCAQRIRTNGVKSYAENMSEEDHAKRKAAAALSNSKITNRDEWRKKISETKRAQAKENLTDEQKQIFGDDWDKIAYEDRGKQRVTVICKDCNNEFTVCYSQYRTRMKHSDNQYHWRCKNCRYAHHANLMREKNPAQAYLKKLTPEELAAIRTKAILRTKSPKNTNEKFEKQFGNSILINDYYIKPEITTSENDIIKHWDYGVYSRENDNLEMVVNIAGAYFHADNCDYDDEHSHELYDSRRFQSVPKGVKTCIIYELKFRESFQNMMKLLMEYTYDEYIEKQLQLCTITPFPYMKYSDEDLWKSYRMLKRMNPNNGKLSLNDRRGDRIIQHYHKSIWSAQYKSRPSPYFAWYNRDILRKIIENRMIEFNNINPNKILQGFNASGIAPKVSVFSAARAKWLIYKYLNDANTIYDPFSGFSGRMLGTVSLGKQYIGSDISPIHVRESNEIIDFLGIADKAKVTVANVLQSSGDYSNCALFTCPPYGTKERWLDVPVDNRSCDDWINECINRFKCSKYLFVVDKTEKYKEFIVNEIVNQSHFGKSSEYVILIPKQI